MQDMGLPRGVSELWVLETLTQGGATLGIWVIDTRRGPTQTPGSPKVRVRESKESAEEAEKKGFSCTPREDVASERKEWIDSVELPRRESTQEQKGMSH